MKRANQRADDATNEVVTIYQQTLDAHEAALEARLRRELDGEKERIHAQVQTELGDRMEMVQSMAERHPLPSVIAARST